MMEYIKILLTRKFLPGDISYIKAGLDEHISGRYSIIEPPEYTEDAIAALAKEADVLFGPYVTEKILKNGKDLKLIQIPWTGLDTFDFEAVRDFDIPICNTHTNADAVAEYGFTLILDLLKKISYHDRKMRKGDWNREQKPLTLKSGMLRGLNVCIAGFGHIGRKLAAMLDFFGSNIDIIETNIIPDFPYRRCYTAEEKSAAVKNADVIVSALPLTDKTDGFIDASLIGKMKDGVLIVNISRARIVDEEAVYYGLERGKIGGFASDVWWKTPARGESLSFPSALGLDFARFENVVFSPHRAGFIEGELPHLDGAVSNIIALYEDRPLEGIVDKHKRY